jgi:Family of unknown function (DUF5677)
MKTRPPSQLVLIALGAASGGLLGFFIGRNQKKSIPAAPQVAAQPGTFEWGETLETDAFFARHPRFHPAFERIVSLSNKCFARPLPTPYYGPEYTLFSLGDACRQEYVEILFLAAHGYGTAASKLLRGFFERAVALAYMLRNRDKVERFCKFAAVQEHKAMKDALKVTTEEQWNAAMGQYYTPAEVTDRFENVRTDFLQTDCKKCGTKRSSISWDIDVASMVAKVGEPYTTYYLMAYTNANLLIHATAASALRVNEKDEARRLIDQRAEADVALFSASILLTEVFRHQNTLMSLTLDDEIQECENAIARVWKEAIDGRTESPYPH